MNSDEVALGRFAIKWICVLGHRVG